MCFSFGIVRRNCFLQQKQFLLFLHIFPCILELRAEIDGLVSFMHNGSRVTVLTVRIIFLLMCAFHVRLATG